MNSWTRSPGRAHARALWLPLAAVVAGLLAPSSPAAPPAGPHPSDARVEQELRREAAVRADRGTPEGRSRRAESRRAYAGAGRDAAIGIAMQRHPELVLLPAWRAPFMPPGESIRSYLNDFAARVSDGTVVESTVPLRGEDGGPVDLRLDQAGSSVAPRNAIAPFRIAKDVRGGVALANAGVRITPLAADETAAPEVVGDTAFFHEAYEDGDYVVKPAATGFSVNVQIRSEASPERYRLRIDVPEGRRLREVRERQAIEVVDGAGEVEATVSVPRAWDADRQPLDLEWSLDGEVMTIDAPHRAHDGAYPYLLDPTVMESYDWEISRTHNYNGWSHFKDTKNNNDIAWHHGDAFLGHGIYAYLLNTMDYNHDDSAGWFFRAPGSARINRSEFNYTTQDWTDGTCLTLGIHKPRPAVNGQIPNPSYRTGYWDGLFEHGQRYDRCDRFYDLYFGLCNVCGETDWTPSNSLVYGIRFDGSRTRSYFWTHVGRVYVYMYDPDTPTIAAPAGGVPSNWGNWPASTPIKLDAADGGLGLRRFSLTSRDVSAYDDGTWNNAYNGDMWDGKAQVVQQADAWREGVSGWCTRTTVCPQRFNTYGNSAGDRNAEIGNLPEGERTLTAVAQDPIGRVRKTTHVVRLDRTKPNVVLNSTSQVGRQVLGDGEWELIVDGRDPHPNGAVNSGVRELRVYVDDVHRWTATQGLQNTDLPATFYWDTGVSGLGEGRHTVRVEAVDGAGNPATPLTFSVYVDFMYARSETATTTGAAEDGSMGDGGWPECTPDQDAETSYCGEHDEDDPEMAQMSNEMALRMFSPLALMQTMPELVARNQAQTAEAAQAAAGRTVGFGLSDQNDTNNVNPWRDPRFRDLRIPHARIVVPWNLVTRAIGAANGGDPTTCGKPPCRDLAWADRWLRQARRGPTNADGTPTYPNGLQVLMSLGARNKHPLRGNREDPPNIPTAREYGDAVRLIIRRYARLHREQPGTYPEVQRFTPWNEPNIQGLPASLAAKYMRKLAALCGDPGMRPTQDDIPCRVVGGDFLDSPNLLPSPGPDGRNGTSDDDPGYFRQYKAALNGYKPRQWAIHAYGCANSNNASLLRQFARATRNTAGQESASDPKIWITEAGGRVDTYRRFLGQSPEQAEASSANEYRNLLGTCLNAHDRYTRLYLYSWSGRYSVDENGDGQIAGAEWRWDSGLTRVAPAWEPGQHLDPNNPAYKFRRRESYCVVYENRNNASCPPSE